MANETENTEVIQEETADTEVSKETVNEEIVNEEPTQEAAGEIQVSDLEDLTPEEKAFFEEVAKNQKTDPKIKRATKNNWKELDDEGKVFTEFGETVVESESARIKEDLVALTASLQSKRILKGTITGVRSVNPDNAIATYLAEVTYGCGGVKVLIPSYALFVYDIKKYTDPNIQNAIANNMQEMIGSEISFIVRSIDKNKLEVIADRLYALQEEGYANFVKIQRDGKPRIVKDCLIQGKVLRVTKYSVTVSALGVDCTIRKTNDKDEISWNYIESCRDIYQPGDDIIVKVLGIQRINVPVYNNNYKIIKGDFSIKQTKVNPIDKYFDEIAEGGRYSATVQAVTDHGVFCELMGKNVTCLCKYPRYGSLPERGDVKIIRVTDKQISEEGKRLYGVFVG